MTSRCNVEAASPLDLSSLTLEMDYKKIIPISQDKFILLRFPVSILIVGTLFGMIGLVVKLINEGLSNYKFMVYILILFLVTRQKLRSSESYRIDNNGLIISYLWFLKRLIKWDDLIDIFEETVIETSSDKEYYALRITLDTSLLKFNRSGLEDASILLSEKDFSKTTLTGFFNEFKSLRSMNTTPPNTVAKRFEDQIMNSWEGRWKLISLNIFDSVSELAFYLFVFHVVFFELFNSKLVVNLSPWLLAIYFSVLFFIHFIERPTTIMGFRGNELGPIVYNENDVVTNIRFMAMITPFTMQIDSCKLIFKEKIANQIDTLKQIHPKEIEPGKLSHVVAQFLGNHSKAIGILVDFIYKEEMGEDITYQLPIYWA